MVGHQTLDLGVVVRVHTGQPVCFNARVVEWQTRKHEGLMPKGVGVQLPPRGPKNMADKYLSANYFLNKVPRLFVVPRFNETEPQKSHSL